MCSAQSAREPKAWTGRAGDPPQPLAADAAGSAPTKIRIGAEGVYKVWVEVARAMCPRRPGQRDGAGCLAARTSCF